VKPIRILERDPTVALGIGAVRSLLPLCEFNTQPIPFPDETPEQAHARMDRALNALRQYRREWDEKLQKFKDAPLHDWTSHTADALRYLARGRKPFVQQPRAQPGGNQANAYSVLD
jgi:phage terminase large subunit